MRSITARHRAAWRTTAPALLLALLAACSPGTEASTADAAAGSEPTADGAGGEATDAGSDVVTLRVAQSTPAEWVQPVLAQEEGHFDEAGLEVEMTEFPSGRDALQALSGGAVEIAMVTPSNVAPSVMGGEDLVVFGEVARWGDWRLVARADRGIAAPEDLAGATIGVPTGTSADQSLATLLEQQGLTAEDVELVNVAPPDMVPALENGTVDAVNIWQPNLSVLEDAVPGHVSIPFEMPSSFLFATTREYAEENPEALLRFLEANQAADALLNDERERALDLMVEPSRIDRPILEAVWEDFTFQTAEPDEQIIDQLAKAAEFVIGNGSQPGPAPDFTEHVVSVGLDD